MIPARRLRQRITLQKPSRSTDHQGRDVVTYTDVATVWAECRKLKGYERERAYQTQSGASWVAYVRWSSVSKAAASDWRVSYDGRKLEVLDVRDPDETRELIILDLAEVPI